MYEWYRQSSPDMHLKSVSDLQRRWQAHLDSESATTGHFLYHTLPVEEAVYQGVIVGVSRTSKPITNKDTFCPYLGRDCLHLQDIGR